MPIVDLAHLTRRPDLEKAVDFSPVAIGIYLLLLAGFALAGWSVVGGFTLKGCGLTLEASRGAEQKYVSSAGDKVRVDFGSRMGQVCYSVSAARGSTRIVMMSYESLWSQPGGWDYITEENAARVIGLLPELVDYLIGLTERAVPRR